MATKKNAAKTSAKAELNLKVDKKTKSNVQKAIKGKSFKTLIVAFVLLLVGIGGGVGAWYAVCRNDCFELVGQEFVEITLEETYVDEGVKIVAFGKDDSKNFEVETNLNVNEQGEFYSDEVGRFYIKYISKNFKYSSLFKVYKIRLVSVVETSEGGE